MEAPEALLRVSRADLGVSPTPVEERRIAGLVVRVKREDRSAPVYGGNKARALQYLLAPPRPARVLTFSTRSAYHALATVRHAARLGIPADVVLLGAGRAGPECGAVREEAARCRQASSVAEAALSAALLWRRGTRVILPGGAGFRGSLGYVAAAFELDPPPARIYVPLGSGTTTCGLLAGLALRGASTEIVAVRVVGSPVTGAGALRLRAGAVLRALAARGLRAPEGALGAVGLRVVPAGGRYGEPTEEALRAMEAAGDLPLEATYTGKALAALLREGADGAMLLATFAGALRPAGRSTRGAGSP